MSSMIKKKGALSFKPKAPQARRPPGAPPSVASSSRQSVERQSQTPAPQARLPSPPPTSVQSEVSLQDAITSQEGASIAQIPDARTTEASIPAQASGAVAAHAVEKTIVVERDILPESVPLSILSAGDQEASNAEHQNPLTHPASTIPPEAVAQEPPEPTTASNIIDSPARSTRHTNGPQEPDLIALVAEEVAVLSQVVATESLDDGASGVPAASKPQKKQRRPAKRRRLDNDNAEVLPSVEVSTDKSRQRAPRKPRQPSEGGKKRKKRAETPSDAEEQEVDHTTVKMADLTKDIKIGKKFSRYTEIKEKVKDRKIKSRVNKELPGLVPTQAGNDGALSIAAGHEEAPVEVSTGPQMRIVNGQIVVDDASLVVDRHAIAAAAAMEMEEVEEDDFTRITTSGTFMKRERNITWNLELTEKFYLGLRMFGTDFEMISKMFPDRNRRQIKLKFNKEEKEFPKKIANALVGETVKIDMEEYKSHTGLEYETVADIQAEHAKFEEEHLEEQRRLQDEAAEMTRQKKAEIQGRSGITATAPTVGSRATPAAGTESAKENEPGGSGALEGGKASAASKSKKKAANKKKKRNLHSVRGGGEEVEVLGSIA